MSTKLKIKVTKNVLKQSMFCGLLDSGKITENCAIAIAVRDVFPKASVNHTAIVYQVGDYNNDIPSIKSLLPYEAMHFISLFDKSSPQERVFMPELEFEVEVPDSVIDAINIDDIKKCATLELVN